MTYEEYLASPWWRARKAAVIRYRGERCERCGSNYRLELHHRTYQRLFHEQPEDVELLCRLCHARHHDRDPNVLPHPGLERLGDYIQRTAGGTP